MEDRSIPLKFEIKAGDDRLTYLVEEEGLDLGLYLEE